MANQQIKFYKVATLPTTLVQGAVYFVKDTQSIHVATSTTAADKFGIGLKNAVFGTDNRLTITRHDDTTVVLDFSDMASAAGMKAVFTSKIGLNADLTYTGVYNTSNTVRADIEAAKAITDTVGAVSTASDVTGTTAFAKIKTLSDQIKAITGEGEDGDATTIAGLATKIAANTSGITDINHRLGSGFTKDATVAAAISAAESNAKEYAHGLVEDKNVAADGETGNTALVSASAGANKVTVAATKKLQDAVALAESALQASDKQELSEAIADAVAAEAEIARAAEEANAADIEKLYGAVAGGVHFAGIYPELPVYDAEKDEFWYKDDMDATLWDKFDIGDIIIVAVKNNVAVEEPNKEYILVAAGTGYDWVELGDINPSTQAIGALEEKHDQQVAAINAYTVNGKKISENPVLGGADVKLTSYAKGSSTAAIAATDTVNAAIAKLENRVVAAQAAGDGGVQSVGGKTGAITVRGSQTANGTVNLTMSNNELQASIVGLKSAAFTESSAYATAEQGAKADTAYQKPKGGIVNDDIADGTIELSKLAYEVNSLIDAKVFYSDIKAGDANGQIKVKDTNIDVTGLKSAAYTDASAYATAGEFQALSNLVGQNANGATGIFKIIEDNEKTTAKALTNLDTRLQEVNSILEWAEF